MTKNGLVIEGGGLRGAYTAGALAWLVEHKITFAYSTAISIGALYLYAYLTENVALMKDVSIHLAGAKDNVGLSPLLREGTLVGYEKLFEGVRYNSYALDVEKLRNADTCAEIGLYDLDKNTTRWLRNQEMDDEILYLKAACTLPMFGRKVTVEGHDYLDGGITTMIPIKESIGYGCEKHLVITTKPADYVRKPYSALVLFLFRLVYRRYPNLRQHIKKRAEYYYEERGIITELEEQGQCLHIYPSRASKVTRLGGSEQDLTELYELGYQDMEAKKAEILKFLG